MVKAPMWEEVTAEGIGVEEVVPSAEPVAALHGVPKKITPTPPSEEDMAAFFKSMPSGRVPRLSKKERLIIARKGFEHIFGGVEFKSKMLEMLIPMIVGIILLLFFPFLGLALVLVAIYIALPSEHQIVNKAMEEWQKKIKGVAETVPKGIKDIISEYSDLAVTFSELKKAGWEDKDIEDVIRKIAERRKKSGE